MLQLAGDVPHARKTRGSNAPTPQLELGNYWMWGFGVGKVPVPLWYFSESRSWLHAWQKYVCRGIASRPNTVT